MTTGRINQVARPQRQAGPELYLCSTTRGVTSRNSSQLSCFQRDFCKARNTKGPRAYTVSNIRDQGHKRGSLDDDGLDGQHREATPHAPCGRRDTPQGRARRRQRLRQPLPVERVAARKHSSIGTGMNPILLKGQGALESAEVQRGASRQSRVQNHSSAPKPLQSSHPSIPTRLARRVY